MKYQQGISYRIKQKIKRKWQKAQNNRLLMDYYRRQNLVEARAPRFFRDIFIYFTISLLFFWFAPTLKIVLGGMIVVFVVMIFWRYSRQQRESLWLKKACFQKVANREYLRRLEKISPEVLLKILQEEICKKFKVKSLEIRDGFLEGSLWGKKLAVVYLDVHGEEFVTTRKALSVARQCLQQGISQLLIFTNGEFDSALRDEEYFVSLLPFAVNIRLYNGEKLQQLLKHTLLFPSVSEIKEIIDCEKLQRQKKLFIIKKEVLKKKRITGYLLYSCVLFFMAWLRLGAVYLNVFVGLILLGFALIATLKSFQI
ncbi:MAG: hypothetical protein ACOX2N_01675 [Peptococcia bacterium]|jgi:hypothetical protein